jgi:hypothetical protein
MKSMILERLGLAPLRHWRDALQEFIKEGVMG